MPPTQDRKHDTAAQQPWPAGSCNDHTSLQDVAHNGLARVKGEDGAAAFSHAQHSVTTQLLAAAPAGDAGQLEDMQQHFPGGSWPTDGPTCASVQSEPLPTTSSRKGGNVWRPSRFKGLTADRKDGRWRVRINYMGKRQYLGK